MDEIEAGFERAGLLLAAYYMALIRGGIPEELAGELTTTYQAFLFSQAAHMTGFRWPVPAMIQQFDAA